MPTTAPRRPHTGGATWPGGPLPVGQHTIPITDGVPHLVAVGESAGEAASLIDISDETSPTVVRHLLQFTDDTYRTP